MKVHTFRFKGLFHEGLLFVRVCSAITVMLKNGELIEVRVDDKR